jgi:cytoskeletal protein CcmA (bactofilin family)
MFNKSPDRDVSPASRPRELANGSASVIGADLKITGNLECRGEVQIDGHVEGNIQAQRIVIGKGASTTGNLLAEAIEVGGNVGGSIRGNAVTLRSSSRVEADVFHKTLSIEQGAFFEGKSRRSNDPMSAQRPADAVLPAK